jgi:hypothetical protein
MLGYVLVQSESDMGASHTMLRAPLARRLSSTPYQRGVCDQRSDFYVDDYVSI